jgi:CPA2 family monovalent cation:H+ antiporter-2
VRAGGALLARGEVSIVIAGIAVAAGAEPELGPVAATYVLLLAIAGPVAARIVDRRIERAKRASSVDRTSAG